MDDDDYPNFGSAFPSEIVERTPTPSAHWNPAMRPDAASSQAQTQPQLAVQEQEHATQPPPESDDDFFDRYPDADPDQSKGRDTTADPEDDPESALRKRSKSVSHRVDNPTNDAQPGEMESKLNFSTDIERPLGNPDDRAAGDSAPPDDEGPVFGAHETVTEQRRELEISSELPAEPQKEDAQTVEEVADAGEADRIASHEQELEPVASNPSQNYEHQGEISQMEEAVDESVEAPLMEDEEPLPTPGYASRANTLGFGSFAEQGGQAGQPANPGLDRSFTTDFTEPPQTQEQQRQETIEPAWPEEGDDQTFGELLDSERQSESSARSPERFEAQPLSDGTLENSHSEGDEMAPPPISQVISHTAANDAEKEAAPDAPVEDILEAKQDTMAEMSATNDAEKEAAPDSAVEDVGEAKEDNMAAMWEAALDDDDLLDDELLDDDEEDAVDPSAVFGDDEDLLEDDPFESIGQGAGASGPGSQGQMQGSGQSQNPAQSVQSRGVSANQYVPTGLAQAGRSPQIIPYSAPGAHFVGQAHGRSAGTPDTGLFDIYNQPGALTQQPQQSAQRPAPPSQAQSFADKSKGGYSSPYDLPMEVVKPRRRPQPPPQVTSGGPAPPPRSSSYTSQPGQPPAAAVPPRAPSVTSMSPPTATQPSGSVQPTSVKSTPQAASGFFEDLPMTVKPRPRPPYTPQAGGMPAPPPQVPGPPQQQQQAPPHSGPSAPPMQPPKRPAAAPTQQSQPAMAGLGLRQPEKMPLMPDQTEMAPPQAPQAPPATSRYSPNAQVASVSQQQSRYSPAPPLQPSATSSVTQSRYSPAPGAQPTTNKPPTNRYASAPAQQAPVNKPQPFAPRTSSPLAYHDKPHPPLPVNISHDSPSSPSRQNGLTASAPSTGRPDSSSSRYSPAEPRGTDPSHTRPRTQSPDDAMKSARAATMGLARSTSSQPPQTKGPVLPHRRQFSRELSFAPPQDERSADPFERWRGHPIFRWTAGGMVVHSFPKQTPYYSSGSTAPTLKCTPGSITVQDASSLMPMPEAAMKFPGPLSARSKGKKKEVVAWLGSKIEELERLTQSAKLDYGVSSDDKKRVEEKTMLWKVTKVFVENDGVLEGNAKTDEEVRKVLLPDLAQMGQVVDLSSPTAAAAMQPDAIERDVLFQLRQALLEGQRERAVFLAEEKKLWGHAMLIASTMGPETWKQVVQSFVRSNVKTMGSDSRSIAALYQIFAGNSEDCVDELVPPSARAGFQMINKVDGSSAGNPLGGLDSWRETLGLVISNRTPGDGQSLLSLGKLLQSYGRPEAASTCFLFARSFAKHSGADDAEAHFVLLGDRQTPEHALGNDLDSILLTEIYEYAASFQLPSSAVAYIPHLQSYKLLHAHELAAYGQTSKAQAYCEHIASAIRSTTRPSQYYHPAFTQAIDDLNRFLSQTPQSAAGGKSFFSKPNMAKVSSGMGSWFTKLVEGEDDTDQASTTPGPGGDVGAEANTPFGMVNGDTGATISRSASGTDLYNPMNGGAAGTPGPYQPMTAQGRYAPSALGQQSQSGGSRYAPSPMPSAYAPGRSSMDSDRSSIPSSMGVSAAEPPRPSSARYASYAPATHQPPQQSLGVPRPEVSRATSDFQAPYNVSASRRGSQQSVQSNLSRGSHEPKPALAEQRNSPYGMYQPSPQQEPAQPQPPMEQRQGSPYGMYQPSPQQEPMQPQPASFEEGGYPHSNGLPSPTQQQPQQQLQMEPQPDPEDGGYAPPTSTGSSYEPPSTSYEPPSTTYQPYQPDPEPDSPVETQSKPRRGIMDDDDDDLVARAAALKLEPSSASGTPSNDRAAADAAADAAFRAAAEADAARDKTKQQPKKSGWLSGGLGGGWFSKKASDSDLSSASGNQPIKAKLGEESSFYYDKDLGKWVNKKGGPEAATPVAATPPPPKGPGSRTASAMGPPSGPPSRVASGSNLPPAGNSNSRPPTSSGLSNPPAGFVMGSQPPSRTGTPASENGGAGGLAPPMPPPSRPGTGLSNASSLDDLMAPGAGGAKKGNTIKGKKRGGRYVDVMAK
ncbi:hypothetical protein MBLNU230_g6425t1 [Neophaeotheca triangularis]